MAQLYQVADQWGSPRTVAWGESIGLRYYAKARHRLDEPVRPLDRATDAKVLGLLGAPFDPGQVDRVADGTGRAPPRRGGGLAPGPEPPTAVDCMNNMHDAPTRTVVH